MMDFAQKRMWSMLGMRGVFAMRMAELAKDHPELVVLTADLGQLSGLDRFKSEYPQQFINAGIAEQNLVGMAAGLAHEGMKPFVTTYATFLSMRSAEQIRHLCAYAKNPVRLIASGAGFAMGMSGNSHYTYEDLSIMRAIPDMTVISPADGAETFKLIDLLLEYDKPIYVRLTGNLNIPMVYKEDYDFVAGKAVSLDENEGKDITVFAAGTMVAESQKAAKILRENGLDVHVVNMHTIKPLDREAVMQACRTSRLLVSVEEHSIVGGLGGAISEVMAEIGSIPPLLRIGMPDTFIHPGEYKYLLEQSGLTSDTISARIIESLR